MTRPLLPPMQAATLHGLARGLTYQQVALEHGVTVSTIRTHAHNAFKRLGAIDATSAVLAYLRTDQLVRPVAKRLHERVPSVGVEAWIRTVRLVLDTLTSTSPDLWGVDLEDAAPAPTQGRRELAETNGHIQQAHVTLGAPTRTPNGNGALAELKLGNLRALYAAARARALREFADDALVAGVLGWTDVDEAVAAVRIASRAAGRLAGQTNDDALPLLASAAAALTDAETDILRVAVEAHR